jgi:hypothetical protein
MAERIPVIKIGTGHYITGVEWDGRRFLGWSASGVLMVGTGHPDPRMCDWRASDLLFRPS